MVPVKLGYLTNIELRLTNQMLTPAFRSNFFSRIAAAPEIGTNSGHMWRCGALSNESGFCPMLPAQDVAAWQRIFRECAERYASNTVPVQRLE